MLLLGGLWTNQVIVCWGYFLNSEVGEAPPVPSVHAVTESPDTVLSGRHWVVMEDKVVTWGFCGSPVTFVQTLLFNSSQEAFIYMEHPRHIASCPTWHE